MRSKLPAGVVRSFVQFVAGGVTVVLAGASGAACLDRPVSAQSPTIKTNFTTSVSQSGIEKVDILFDVDNSASMGDKQQYLIEAIPQMVARLVTPRCLDDASGAPTQANASATDGSCASGSSPEFAAVHDLHLGVVTSSLGSRLGDECDPTATVTSAGGVSVNAHRDDQGHLINRAPPFGSGAPLADANLPEGGGFLAWFPSLGNGGASPVTPPAALSTSGAGDAGAGTLVGDFAEILGGAGQSGCGLESQLESWYRFLIQPDPYATLVNVKGKAVWSGVDTTILQQRHDFLRPDSLVAVIVLSDENDSEMDVRSFQGSGYLFLDSTYAPPRASAACATDPNSPTCATCAAGSQDPSCQANVDPVSHVSLWAGNNWGKDPNLRHVHMRQKYGLDAQFPLTRYTNGLGGQKVPNRNGEYPPSADGYVGTNNCTNPLFAAALPQASDVADATAVTPAEVDTTLCNLEPGSGRTAGDVFYAHIGGVPHQLLQSTPGDGTCAAGTPAADCPQKDTLAKADWVKILGNGPAAYTAAGGAMSFDYSGIDPHMIESMTPRNVPGLPNAEPAPASIPPASTLSGPALATSASDPVRPDPINGREWTTDTGVHSLTVDREYACIFQLPVAEQRDCATFGYKTIEGVSCDCIPGGGWSNGGPAAATGNTGDQVPPLCSKATTDGKTASAVGDYTVQTHAKAYPTTRELTLANMMGPQGVVSSLCPIHTEDNATHDDPLYGYRPAVNAIVNRLKNALTPECVPQLQADSDGNVACLVLVSFPATVAPSGTSCGSIPGYPGYADVDTAVLKQFHGAQPSLASELTCQLAQVPAKPGTSCAGGGAPGWCYVTGAGTRPGGTCTQEIDYTASNVVPRGAVLSLQCIATE